MFLQRALRKKKCEFCFCKALFMQTATNGFWCLFLHETVFICQHQGEWFEFSWRGFCLSDPGGWSLPTHLIKAGLSQNLVCERRSHSLSGPGAADHHSAPLQCRWRARDCSSYFKSIVQSNWGSVAGMTGTIPQYKPLLILLRLAWVNSSLSEPWRWQQLLQVQTSCFSGWVSIKLKSPSGTKPTARTWGNSVLLFRCFILSCSCSALKDQILFTILLSYCACDGKFDPRHRLHGPATVGYM